MDITFISDAHSLHQELKLKPGTILIHAGDITEFGTKEEVADFLEWFGRQPYQYKIFIAGNHDLFLEECKTAERKKLMPEGIMYLQNSGVTIEGINIWGSPVTPYFFGMAFNVKAGKAIKKVWNKISPDTDILITHGPPKGILENNLGCEELYKQVTIVKPVLHCFGHIHGVHGSVQFGQTNYINAALVNTLNPFKNEDYKIIGSPIYKQYTI